jgi:undecaprenyl-diphosphatase
MNYNQFLEWILAIVLGLVQGVTEFLPISSTAHLRLIAATILNGRDIGLMASNIIQFGTLLAILVYFRKDLSSYLTRLKQIASTPSEWDVFSQNLQRWWSGGANYEGQPAKVETDVTLAQLFVGTMPLIVLGYFLHNFADETRELGLIAAFLIAGSSLMGFAEWQHRRAMAHPEPRPYFMTPGEVILIGLFQTLAAFPGISRSGATLSGALMLGRDRAKSVRFSFLLSIPSLLLLSLYDLWKVLTALIRGKLTLLPMASNLKSDRLDMAILPLLLACVLAYFGGLIFLRWLLKYLANHSTRSFIIYRVGLGLLILIYVYSQLLK